MITSAKDWAQLCCSFTFRFQAQVLALYSDVVHVRFHHISDFSGASVIFIHPYGLNSGHLFERPEIRSLRTCIYTASWMMITIALSSLAMCEFHLSPLSLLRLSFIVRYIQDRKQRLVLAFGEQQVSTLA